MAGHGNSDSAVTNPSAISTSLSHPQQGSERQAVIGSSDGQRVTSKTAHVDNEDEKYQTAASAASKTAFISEVGIDQALTSRAVFIPEKDFAGEEIAYRNTEVIEGGSGEIRYQGLLTSDSPLFSAPRSEDRVTHFPHHLIPEGGDEGSEGRVRGGGGGDGDRGTRGKGDKNGDEGSNIRVPKSVLASVWLRGGADNDDNNNNEDRTDGGRKIKEKTGKRQKKEAGGEEERKGSEGDTGRDGEDGGKRSSDSLSRANFLSDILWGGGGDEKGEFFHIDNLRNRRREETARGGEASGRNRDTRRQRGNEATTAAVVGGGEWGTGVEGETGRRGIRVAGAAGVPVVDAAGIGGTREGAATLSGGGAERRVYQQQHQRSKSNVEFSSVVVGGSEGSPLQQAAREFGSDESILLLTSPKKVSKAEFSTLGHL